MRGRYTGALIAKLVFNTLRSVSALKKLLGLTRDNASNNSTLL
jgi:hypothetical protein